MTWDFGRQLKDIGEGEGEEGGCHGGHGGGEGACLSSQVARSPN